MLFAPDFFSYFEATSRILDQARSRDDPCCVVAYRVIIIIRSSKI